jgi:SAM-dependent methyltransferase
VTRAAGHDPGLLADIKRHYRVGLGYATAYLDYWSDPRNGRHAGRVFTSLDEILALPPPDSMWFDYALSTNVRGRALCDLTRRLPQAPSQAGRFLDVGCGFGGLMVAFARQGFEVRGIELDPQRVQFARANCADFGLESVVRAGDILDDGLAAALGQFDIVSMIDVIEHVADMPRALEHVVSLLNPGGIVVLEIPNRDSVNFIAADGHFSLFGITLLDRPEATLYHRAIFGTPYEVGEYYPLGNYLTRLEGHGCHVEQVPSVAHVPRSIFDLPELLRAVEEKFAAYRRDTQPRIAPAIDARLQERLASYVSALMSAWRRIDTPEAAAAFANQYLVDFWTIVAKKHL